MAKASKTKASRSKDESDIAKYFKDSLMFLSDADAEKENGPQKNQEIGLGHKKGSKNIATSSKPTINDIPSTAGRLVKEKIPRGQLSGQLSQICSSRKKKTVVNPREAMHQRNKNKSPSKLHVQKSREAADSTTELSCTKTGLSSNMEIVLGAEALNCKRKKSFDQTSNSSIETSSRILTIDRCKLASWGLPLTILRKYESHGVTSMFPWQVECLSNAELLEKNRNLVYSAPTSAGKTLVAEILVIKTILERRKKVIFILPFVSVVREKMYYFQDLLTESGFRVEGFMGGCAPAGGFAATDVAIATIEKANSLLNQLMEEGNLSDLGAVVIDELHLLGDPHRGYLLELLLTKLKYMNLRDERVHVQLIGMSATLPNLVLLAKWLDAELYKTDFRPVPLNEQCKIAATIYDRDMKTVRNLQMNPSFADDSDNVLQLCIETLSDSHSVLIFCPTKNWCETLARQVATKFSSLGRENTSIGTILREQLTREAIIETLEQLKRCPAGLDSVLKSTVSFGTAFHHAGLTMDERDVIEGAFRSGAIRVLTATSTLSSGVNLPARRVIIRSLMFHGKPLDTLTYRQMVGRAGRMGKDTAGESILICKNNEMRAATTLLTSDLPPIESCLEGSEPMIRALLEAVASEVAYTAKDIDLYTKCTLVSVTSEDLIERSTNEAIKFLVDNELFMLQTSENGDQRWIATQLGKACLAASIPPTDGLFIFEELQKARKCFVLDTELHVIYLVTPINSSSQIGQIDWFVFMNIWKSLTESERRVGQLVGVDENFLMSAIRGSLKNGKILDVHKRFYTAMALHDLVREVSLIDVCRKYGVCRGVIQSLQQSAATFAGMVTQFCKKLGWDCMELLIGQFQARLQFGVCRELLDLLRLPMLNGLRARSLYKEGITCVAELAVANVLDVERGLHKALPFESGKEYNGEHEFDAAKRNKMRSVFVTGRDGLTIQEAAIILVREARTLVQNELGLDELHWKQREHLTTNTQSSNSSTSKLLTESTRQSAAENDVHVGNANADRCETEELRELSIVENQADKIERVDVQIRETTSPTTISGETRLSESRTERYSRTSSASSIAPKANVLQPQSRTKDPEKNVKNSRTVIVSRKIVTASNSRNVVDEEGVEISIAGKSIELNDFTRSMTNKEIYLDGTFEFTDTPNSIDPEVMIIGSKTSEEICKENISEFAQTSNIIYSKKAAVPSTSRSTMAKKIFKENSCPSNTQRTMSEDVFDFDNSFEFTDIPNPIDREVMAIGTKSSEEICKENISELKNTVNTSNPLNSKEDAAPSKARRTMSDDVFDFDDTAEFLDANNVNRSKLKKNIQMEDTFVFPGSENPIDSEVTIIGSKRCKGISKENISRSSKASNVNDSKKVTVPSKTRRTVSEDFFDFGKSTESIDPKDVATPITGDSVCKEIFKFTGTGDRAIDPEENVMSPGNKLSTMSPINLLRESLTNHSDSRSPSLFDESLNLDSQECNMLEQNVIGSLNVSAFGETNINIESERNTPENRRSKTMKTSRRSSASSHRRSSLINSISRRSPRISELINKSSKSLVWGDDSWNNTNGAVDSANMLNTAILSKVHTPPNSVISGTPETCRRRDHEDRLFPKNRVTELQITSRKRRSSESNIEISPITSIIQLTEVRRLSVDYSKSDSDDVVTPSQSTRTSMNITKNRTRLKLESLRKSRTQKNPKSKELEEYLTDKNVLCERCSIGSVVCSSEEDSPINRRNMLAKKKRVLSVEKTVCKQRKRLLSPVSKQSIDETEFKKPASICPKEIQVVNVTTSLGKFNQFKKELLSKRDIALALASETSSKNSISIGTKIIGITSIDGRKKTKKVDNCVYGNKKICGVAVSWDGIVVQYISFDNSRESKVSVKERLDLLTSILTSSDLTVRCFSFKETYKILYNCCRITSSCKFLDPITADWLLNPDHSDRNFNSLIAEHFPEAQFLLQQPCTNGRETAHGSNVKSVISSEIRATTEAALTWNLTNNLMRKLEATSSTLLETFRDIEMAVLPLIARMELSGLGINLTSLQELSQVIQEEMSQLENKAYSLAGKRFNFSSSKSVAQILELSKGKKVSTSKAVLEHCENPIARLVMSWRKLSVTQVKVVFPLLSLAEWNSRIHGNCITNTVTGRISMHEPNLQNVPRDFNSHDDSYVISVRMAFVPMNGNLILSADYCQLELRILAHFSKEPNLCRILSKEGDVFKNIAARWYNVAEDKIDDNMRQRTKQLCYGMIYGMGTKALAETLAVTEREAKEFSETFMGAYPGIRKWLTRVVEQARLDGYVTTLMSRRRFLPALNSEKSSERAQAERQAVNTTVQGSAADIAKKAMVQINERMNREFPDGPLVLTDIPMKRKLRGTSPDKIARGGHLVLQIHDELLYEVNATDLQQVGKIVKESMEKSCKLRVPLPVKLKVGQTWGDLTEMRFE